MLDFSDVSSRIDDNRKGNYPLYPGLSGCRGVIWHGTVNGPWSVGHATARSRKFDEIWRGVKVVIRYALEGDFDQHFCGECDTVTPGWLKFPGADARDRSSVQPPADVKFA